MDGQPNFSSLFLAYLAVGGGLVMLTGGGELLVAGATRLARRLGLSPLLIGLTVVAFGTSLPELFVALLATVQGHPDIMIGNVVGSNIANVGLILGISALLAPLPVRLRAIATELWLVLGGGLTVTLIAWHGTFQRWQGVVFVLLILLYTVESYRRAIQTDPSRQESRPGQEQDPQVNSFLFSGWFILISLAAGFGLLAVGSAYFIDGAVDVARHYGVSELVIGLTLAALGTSLPELASCLAAARQRQGDLLLGNVVGSNLFNLLMVMGCAGAVQPFVMSGQTIGRDLPVMIAFSAVLIPLLAWRHGLQRLHGLLFLVAYGVYVYMLI
jgi:cation:H+ antiporter